MTYDDAVAELARLYHTKKEYMMLDSEMVDIEKVSQMMSDIEQQKELVLLKSPSVIWRPCFRFAITAFGAAQWYC